MKERGHILKINIWPLFIFLFLFIPSFSSASDLSANYITKAKKLALAENPTWKGLLHFKSGKSEILEEKFFLSGAGHIDAQAELEATIKAYFDRPPTKQNNLFTKVECAYPARLTWLNKKLNLPDFSINNDTCPALSRWARLSEVNKISVVYVSGYLGNPASSFGHVLLNFKTTPSASIDGLLDTSVSYGATVPLNEDMLNYIFKGLFGGYSSTFSDKFYYAHDQVYSNREARDMWEYTLNLSDFNRKLLVYHVAELLTKNFRYFFLSKNCAQKMAELLDIFIEEDIYPLPYPIYVPEELFNRLKIVDDARINNKKEGLIDKVSYIPSARRNLYYEIKRLSGPEKNAFRKISADKRASFSQLENLDYSGRIHVLNALLSYQYYRLMASDRANIEQEMKEYKNKILLERLRHPSMKVEPLKVPKIPSPESVSPPSAINLGVVFEHGEQPFSTFGLTVFKKESTGLTALEYNELIALDLSIGIFHESKDVFIDRFNFLKITNFRTFYIEEANESPVSWRFRAGVDRFFSENNNHYDFVLDGGVGMVKRASNHGIIYSFISASMHSIDDPFRLNPTIGIIIGSKKLKVQADLGIEVGGKNLNLTSTTQLALQYQINKRNAFTSVYENNTRERFTLNYTYFW